MLLLGLKSVGEKSSSAFSSPSQDWCFEKNSRGVYLCRIAGMVERQCYAAEVEIGLVADTIGQGFVVLRDVMHRRGGSMTCSLDLGGPFRFCVHHDLKKLR